MGHFLQNLAAVAGFTIFTTVAHSQVLGGGQVRVLVGGAAGGPSDSTIRLIAPRLSAALGQPLVVENRPGTVGQVAVEQLKNAAPDGKTLMLGNSGTHAIIPSVYRKIRYDPLRDCTPITLINTTGLVLVANPSLPVRSIPDFIALAKREPGKITLGVAGPTGELAAEAFMAPARIRMTNVRYKGSSPAEVAVLSGEVAVALLTPVASVSHLNVGKLRALGVTASERLPLLPNVPTIAELGVKGYYFHFWNGLFAPPGTPAQVVRLLQAEVVKALDHAETRERFTALGFVIIGSKPEEFVTVIKGEMERYRKIVADAGLARD